MQADDFRADLPVSRGQWKRIAELASQLLGERPPADRFAATVLLVRLEETVGRQDQHAPAAFAAGF